MTKTQPNLQRCSRILPLIAAQIIAHSISMSIAANALRRFWQSAFTHGKGRVLYTNVRGKPVSSVSCLHVPDWIYPYRLVVDSSCADQLAAFRTLSWQRSAHFRDTAERHVSEHVKQRNSFMSSVSSKMNQNTSSCVTRMNLNSTNVQPNPNSSTTTPRIAPIGHSILLLIRSPLSPRMIKRLARTCRRRQLRSTSLLSRLNATASMALATTLVGTEHHQYNVPPIFLRLLASTEGPHRIGIGWIPSSWHTLLAALCAILLLSSLMITLTAQPQLAPWTITLCAVLFSSRPDLASFFQWTKESAPYIAQQKTLYVDKVRATLAPYMLQLVRRPTLKDYGLFSIVVAVDTADYVYVYAGVLSRWCLLGWYNLHDDYNFDKLKS